MNPEARVLNAVVRELDRRKKAGEPLWWIKIRGSAMQRAGVPDLIVCYGGILLGVELKAPGEAATPLQVETMRRIELAGGRCAVLHGVEELKEFLAAVTSQNRKDQTP